MNRFTECTASCLKSSVIFVASTIQRVPSMMHEKNRKHTHLSELTFNFLKSYLQSMIFQMGYREYNNCFRKCSLVT